MTNSLTAPPPVETDGSDLHRLVSQARRGSRTAFHQLMTRFQEPIYRMVYHRVRSDMDAQDLTQDIFLKAYRNIRHLQSEALFKSWLFSIALNRVRDHFRRKRWTSLFVSVEDTSGPEGEESMPSDASGPEEDLLRKDFWQGVEAATAVLSGNERETFVLRFFDQLSIGEIAAVMKKNENTVKTHLYRAIKKMKDRPFSAFGSERGEKA